MWGRYDVDKDKCQIGKFKYKASSELIKTKQFEIIAHFGKAITTS